MARKNENEIARGDEALADPSELPIELLQDVEKQLQAKMRAMQEAGVPLAVAAATSNHLVENLLIEVCKRCAPKGGASLR